MCFLACLSFRAKKKFSLYSLLSTRGVRWLLFLASHGMTASGVCLEHWRLKAEGELQTTSTLTYV